MPIGKQTISHDEVEYETPLSGQHREEFFNEVCDMLSEIGGVETVNHEIIRHTRFNLKVKYTLQLDSSRDRRGFVKVDANVRSIGISIQARLSRFGPIEEYTVTKKPTAINASESLYERDFYEITVVFY